MSTDLQVFSQSLTGKTWKEYQKSYISVSDYIAKNYPVNVITAKIESVQYFMNLNNAYLQQLCHSDNWTGLKMTKMHAGVTETKVL